MIITVLPNKYRCGSNKGITSIEYPGLVVKLNQIINWDLSKFPLKPKKIRMTQILKIENF